MWSLPIAVEIDGKEYAIRNKCDYRVVLDVIAVLKDNELNQEEKIKCSLFIFYEDITGLEDVETAVNEMLKIINVGEEEENNNEPTKPQLMDWEHDFTQIAPPISRTLGYSVRDAKNYTHWYDFIGAYMEIGECTFSNIITIRSKKQKGKPLEKWEQEFYRENKKLVDLPQNLTEEEKEWLDSDWQKGVDFIWL